VPESWTKFPARPLENEYDFSAKFFSLDSFEVARDLNRSTGRQVHPIIPEGLKLLNSGLLRPIPGNHFGCCASKNHGSGGLPDQKFTFRWEECSSQN
jgi:hypothetical protein